MCALWLFWVTGCLTEGADARYGIRAIDTSVYYGPSEIVLGNVLHALRDEFPRSSYKLVRFW